MTGNITCSSIPVDMREPSSCPAQVLDIAKYRDFVLDRVCMFASESRGEDRTSKVGAQQVLVLSRVDLQLRIAQDRDRAGIDEGRDGTGPAIV